MRLFKLLSPFKAGARSKPQQLRRLGLGFLLSYFLASFLPYLANVSENLASAGSNGPIIEAVIDGTINPATDDYLRTAMKEAEARGARLLVIRLNTPGGLLTSMQKMVETLLEAPVPTVVYVSPAGGGAISAGVFITLAANIAVMAPGTNIGAAHPVLGGGGEIKGDMGEKIENFTASLIKAIAEQRGRNVKWAELAVRESVAITDKEAVAEGVVDLVASDLPKLLAEIEGRTVTVKGKPVTLEGLSSAPIESVEMSLKQIVVNILADPNIAVLLGLGAMLGIGIELYHPGGIIPGVVGVICLVLSLVASQVLPIDYGGLALLLLSAVFFVVELFLPAFGIWGAAGVLCLVLGSLYVIDTDFVWAADGLTVDKWLIGTIAAVVGSLLAGVCYLTLRSQRRAVRTGAKGMLGQLATVKGDFTLRAGDSDSQEFEGKVEIMGELWRAVAIGLTEAPEKGARLRVKELRPKMTLLLVAE